MSQHFEFPWKYYLQGEKKTTSKHGTFSLTFPAVAGDSSKTLPRKTWHKDSVSATAPAPASLTLHPHISQLPPFTIPSPTELTVFGFKLVYLRSERKKRKSFSPQRAAEWRLGDAERPPLMWEVYTWPSVFLPGYLYPVGCNSWITMRSFTLTCSSFDPSPQSEPMPLGSNSFGEIND